MKARKKVIPFRGQLQSLITRKLGKNVKLSEEEKLELQNKGIAPPKTRKVRRKELDGLFTVYGALIAPDEFMLQVLNKEVLYKNYNVGLVKKFQVATKYLRLKFENTMSENFRQDMRRVETRLETFEKFLLELAMKKTPVKSRLAELKSYVSKAEYKTKMIPAVADLLEDCFKLIGVPVSTRQKRNSALGLPFLQFSLASKIESALNKASKSETDRYLSLKRALKAQEAQLHEELQEEGLVVRQTRDYFKSDDGSGMSFATVGYDPKIADLGNPPRKPYRNKQISDADYAVKLEEYKLNLAQYKQKAEQLVVAVFSPLLKTEDGTSYQRFTSMEEYRNALINKKKTEVLLAEQFPSVEVEKKAAGFKTVQKKVKKEDGTEEIVETQEQQYEFVSTITFGAKKDGPRYTAPSYLERLSEAYGEVGMAQISDGTGDSKAALTRVAKTQKMLIGDQEHDVIIEGRFKGFLLEDIVNTNGRLIEGSYFTLNSKGEKEQIELIDSVYVDKTLRSSRGKALGDVKINPTKDKEVSFLEFGEKTDAGYRKILNNRLKEPYITVSNDGTRLVLGIPSTEAHTEDRNAVKGLAKILPGLEQKKDPRLSSSANGRNPFYYFDAPSYEALRNTLGSVALSKRAVDFLEEYYKELTARDRALEDDNVKRFNASEIGGFVDTFRGKPFNFNNKQKEAMAWMEANSYSGMMALDTGVGKTLLAGGAMMHYINHKEASGGGKKFLFVSPKRLQGNFSREMGTFLKDKGVIVDRIEEMNYTKFTNIMREIDTLEGTMKLEAEKRDRKLAKIPVDFWKDPIKLVPKYKSATEYFKANYQMCFFDEVNEALTGRDARKRKAISDLKHPNKIMLTASPMKNDPLDLYRFVAVAKGDSFSKAKERAFAERFGNVIGGRFVGLKNDPEVRQEFNTWVKANAYFADKQDVNLEEINMPKLLRPTEEIRTIRMDPQVEAAYKKVSKDVQRELKAMVKKYRDVLNLGEEYRDSSFQNGKKAIQDFAMGSLKKIKDLITLSTNPGKYFKDRNYPNPKLEEAERILEARPGKRLCYFSADEAVVKQNAIKLSNSGLGGVHAAMLDKKIEFYRTGKLVGSIEKKTGKSEVERLDQLMRTATMIDLDYSFITDPVLQDKIRDFKELAEGNLELYKENLEVEELAEIQTKFTLFVNAIREKSLSKVKATLKKLDSAYFKTFDFVADQWAVDISKTTIKNNPNIKTLSCTDAYAKGFNFQFIDTVIHLDRGEGFDSENVKQRTARAYRTGQDKQVEVIFLDSMIGSGKHTLEMLETDGDGNDISVTKKDAENISLDELKALVQQTDQNFFMDVIQQGQSVNLIDTYESVRRTTGEIVNTNRNLFSQILNPTAENIAAAQTCLYEEENTPLKAATLNGERFVSNPGLLDVISESAGMSGITTQEVKDTLDTVGISTLGIHHFSKDAAFVVEKGEVMSQGKFLSLSMSIEEQPNGEVVVHNNYIQPTDCAPKGTASKVIFGQITKALSEGVSSKITASLRASDVLPMRLGFSAKVSLPFLAMASENLSLDEIYIKEWLGRYGLISDDNKVEISHLFACSRQTSLVGQKWWSENSRSVSVPSKGTLDLNPNSTSMKLINAYFNMKCKQMGVSPSQYLSMQELPFDIDDPACWVGELSDKSNAAEAVGNILAYRKEFKIAFYANPALQELTPESVISKLKLVKGKYSEISMSENPVMTVDPKKQSKDPLLDEAWLAIGNKMVKVGLRSEEAFERGDVLVAEEITSEEIDDSDAVETESELASEAIENVEIKEENEA